jgi:hypothetical protein
MKISIRSFPQIVSALASLTFAIAPLAAAPGKTPKPPAPPPEMANHESSEGTTVRTKFSDPAKPGTLKLALPWAEVYITGTDGNEVIVTSSLAQKGKGEVDDEGFRRLDEEVSFDLTEKDNVVTIVIVGDNPWAAQDAQFHIQVPRSTNLSLQTETGGDVRVESVSGEIDINSMNGEVTLIDPGSSAVVNTMNGEINAVFKTAPVKPVSLSSMNGEIALTLPSETKANLRMRSHNGSIRTNFPDSILQSKNENRTPDAETSDAERDYARAQRDAERAVRDAERAAMEATHAAVAASASASTSSSITIHTTPTAPKAPRPPHIPRVPMPPFGGKSIVGTLNGGGTDIQLATMNGSITLRQSK